jgi:hypothetical protein
MRHLVSELKLLLAAVFICLGMLFLTQVVLISDTTLISEKGIAFLLLAFVFLALGVMQVVKAVKRI